MQGNMALLNPRRGMAAVCTADGEYISFGILGSFNLEIGDVISGDFGSLERATWRNETIKIIFEVYVEDIHGTREAAKQIISEQ